MTDAKRESGTIRRETLSELYLRSYSVSQNLRMEEAGELPSVAVPRVDAEPKFFFRRPDGSELELVDSGFAKRLERELNELKAKGKTT